MDQARQQVGGAVHAERKRRELSIETAAKAGGIGHMTWRKIEMGGSVHDQSLYAIDRAFGWRMGHTLATVQTNGDLLPAPPATDPSSDEPVAHKGDTSEPEDPNETFHHVLSLLENLSLPELKTVARSAEHISNEFESIFDTMSKWLDSIPTSPLQNEFPQTEDKDAHRKYINVWSKYMDELGSLMELKSKFYTIQSRPVKEMGELKIMHNDVILKFERLNDYRARALEILTEAKDAKASESPAERRT